MPKRKTDTAKKSLLRRVRRQRLKYISILPSLITIVNGVCGFTAIILASKGAEQAIAPSPVERPYFALSGYMILLAMIADMLDGQLARKVKGTSSFGGQLDSLCDVISFGAAPVFLMLKIVECKLELASFAGDNSIQRFIWLAAAAYLSCAIIRLARFNVENEEGESVLNAVVYALPFLALGVGALMVSRLRYPHVLNQYFKGRKPFGHFIRVLLLLALLFSYPQIALVLAFCGFVASSLVRWIYFRVPVSKYVARWNPKAIRNEDNSIRSAQHSSVAGGDRVPGEGHDDSTGRLEPE
ncbi:MAG: CDP-alcohol phosphatidyltransferase family protein [Planctomycetota bacterium]|jgi:CDP-diacylglycerol--serine O-phosphatidyltransferase